MSAANASGRILIATCAIQLRVARAVDLAHAAGANCGDDFIGTEPRARGQRHRGPLELYGDTASIAEGKDHADVAPKRRSVDRLLAPPEASRSADTDAMSQDGR